MPLAEAVASGADGPVGPVMLHSSDHDPDDFWYTAPLAVLRYMSPLLPIPLLGVPELDSQVEEVPLVPAAPLMLAISDQEPDDFW